MDGQEAGFDDRRRGRADDGDDDDMGNLLLAL